jgi:hypothetical protein
MQQLSSSKARAAAAASRTGPRKPRSIAAAALKRAKQYVARKELQNAAKHEYLKQVYEVRWLCCIMIATGQGTPDRHVLCLHSSS